MEDTRNLDYVRQKVIVHHIRNSGNRQDSNAGMSCLSAHERKWAQACHRLRIRLPDVIANSIVKDSVILFQQIAQSAVERQAGLHPIGAGGDFG